MLRKQEHLGHEVSAGSALGDCHWAANRPDTPVHCIERLPITLRYTWPLHLGDSGRREKDRVAEAPTIELGDQEVPEILRAGARVRAGGQVGAVDRHVGGDRYTKPVA